MRILFTGGTSFTGMWFLAALVEQGHDVAAVLRGGVDCGSELRQTRLDRIAGLCRIVPHAPFGSPAFLDAIADHGPFDLLCHHGAEVTNYKSSDFDAAAAAAANTAGILPVLAQLARGGCRRLLLTGTVFEADEGRGTAPLRAFSPYGLSKTLTWQIFRYYAEVMGVGLGKFVLANPFGPLEEARFTRYLMNCWARGEVARVNTPLYFRDNVPVSLLALAYADFARAVPTSGVARIGLSEYAESQEAFARRFAHEMRTRLPLDCRLEIGEQSDFSEPLVRVNTDTPPGGKWGWDEAAAWNALADYYRTVLSLR